MNASPVQVTPAWLTGVLRGAGGLPRGEVMALGLLPTDAFNSSTLRLRPTYSSDAPETAPHSLILKGSNGTDWGNRASRDEVGYYRFTASLPDYPLPMVPCYGAESDETGAASYLLLLDLSATHLVPVPREDQIVIDGGKNVPAEIYIERAIDAFAALHAYWWEHALLGSEGLPFSLTDDEFADYCLRRRDAVDWLLKNESDVLSPEMRAQCVVAAVHFDRWWADYLAPRMKARSRITLMHGDAYFANMLSPREGVTGETYLIDWQSPEAHLGACDLVNLCDTFWTREQRAEDDREHRILKRYLAQLQAHGVQNYDWDNLVLDYRLEIIEWLLTTVQDARNGSKRSYWLPKLQCISSAFADWHCSDLLTPA